MENIYIPSAIALVSAAIAFAARSNRKLVKTLGLLASAIVLGDLVVGQDYSVSNILEALIAAIAFICILSQKLVQNSEKSICKILLLTGLCLLSLTANAPETLNQIGTGGALLFLIAILTRRGTTVSVGAMVVSGLAILGLVLAASMGGANSSIYLLLTAGALLPLFPLHGLYVGLLSGFTNTFQAFVAFALPCIGLQIVVTKLSTLPENLVQPVAILAITGAVFSLIRASVQVNLARTFASIATVMVSLGWLGMAAKGSLSNEILWYFVSSSMVVSGLLLCTHHLESRYGLQLRDSLSGLASSMPKLGLLFAILLMAAAGFPPFSVFTSFVAMLLSSNQIGITITASTIFLSFSLLLVFVVKEVMFGPQKVELYGEDLNGAEVTALTMVTALMVVTALIPYTITASSIKQSLKSDKQTENVSWNSAKGLLNQ